MGKQIELRIADNVSIEDSVSVEVGKSITVAKKGYADAVERLRKVAGDGTRPDEVQIALVEATNWLDSLAGQTPLRQNVDVQAVLFARHRAHHQWSSATFFDAKRNMLVWRPTSQLPVPAKARYRNEKIEPLYEGHLSGQPVLEVFARLESLVGAARPA